jgi:hypothetical protein
MLSSVGTAGHIIFSVIVKYKLLEARFRDHTGGVVESSPVILLYYFIYHYAVRECSHGKFLRVFGSTVELNGFGILNHNGKSV